MHVLHAATAHLPVPLTSFVGREAEIATATNRLQSPACRLLTLTGPGGIGKTRLALEIARRMSSVFPDGVYLVELAALRTHEAIIAATATATGCYLQGAVSPQDHLLAYLRPKTALLILDNFEHVLDEAPLLMAILAAAPNLKILDTSREVLRTQGEWVLEVGVMDYPVDPDDTAVESYSAARLLLDRLEQLQADFSPQCVARVCQMVEGMPLAIELAASWMRALPCDEVADEVARGLDMLTTHARDIELRHRSMRAALDRSWGLMAPDEHAVLVRLSVFRGGFSRDAAAVVAGATLSHLSALMDKSMIRREAGGRYNMHELIRQYAREQVEPGALAETRDRHCAYFAAFLEGRQDGLGGRAAK